MGEGLAFCPAGGGAGAGPGMTVDPDLLGALKHQTTMKGYTVFLKSEV